MKTARSRCASALCAGLICALPAAASPAASDKVLADAVKPVRDALAPLIDNALQRFKIPGISLTLVDAGQVLWAEGFGVSDAESGTPANCRTVYRAGSLAKPLTAMAVMQLAERNQVNIDRPLHDYLPSFSIRSRFDLDSQPITVRNLLDHHAGLPTDINKGMWTATPHSRVIGQLHEEYTAFPPRFVFCYSNVGYTLLGNLIEQVTAIDYPEYMRERVFAPLGMGDSRFSAWPPEGPNAAKGHRDGRPVRLLPMRDVPAYGLNTSAHDLGRLLQAILAHGAVDAGRQILARGSIEAMFEPQNRDVLLDLDVMVGLGWFLEQDSIPGGGAVIRHGGTTLAFGGEMILLPERGLGVVVLANAEGSRPIAAKLAEAILDRVLHMDTPAPPIAVEIADLDKTVQRFETAEVKGAYATDFGLLSIDPADDSACACMVDANLELIPLNDGWYAFSEAARGALPPSVKPLAQLSLRTERVAGREVVIARRGEQRFVLGEKLPALPVPDSWLSRIGKYKVINPDSDFPLVDPELKLRHGHLCMSYRMPRLSSHRIQMALTPISDTEAVVVGIGRTRGETLRVVKEDGEERLRYSGFVGRKIDE